MGPMSPIEEDINQEEEYILDGEAERREEAAAHEEMEVGRNHWNRISGARDEEE